MKIYRQKPLLVIVGPTASGKTAAAIKLAKEFDGEIICADSRTIYRGMDIGTAKPSIEEQAGVPHWGIDLVKPGQRFTAYDFKQYADEKIADIRHRNKLPILVGGTGLYVDAVLFDYQFPSIDDSRSRSSQERKTVDQLQEYCKKHNINLPENTHNKRHLVNAILRKEVPKRRRRPVSNSFVVGITTDISELEQRIAKRFEEMWDRGVVNEAARLGHAYGWENEAMSGNIYPLLKRYLAGELSKEEVKAKFITLDRQLAKRQLTWLKRNEHIKWLALNDVHTYCVRHLDSLNKT